jgi:rare lipoprotein A
MKQVLWAAVAVIAFGLFGGQSAHADWKDGILGPSYFRAEAEREQNKALNRAARTSRSERAERSERPERPVRVARATINDEEPAPRTKRRAARSDGDEGGSSLGGGMASYYWQPQRVASGGWFNPNAMTAAHKTLPFGTRVRVTNANNGQSTVVTINDRGPYVAGRVIDLSSAAAGAINMKGSGVVPVRMTVLGR